MPPRSEDASESKELLTPCRKCGRSEDLILGHSHFFELRFGVSVRVVRNCALTNNISSRLNNNCEVLLSTTPDETCLREIHRTGIGFGVELVMLCATSCAYAEAVQTLIVKLGLKGDEPAVLALGGLPRACERFLNRHRAEKDPVAKAAKHMAEMLAGREEHRLDSASGINQGGMSIEVRRRMGAVWPGYWCGRSPSGSPVCHYTLGHLKVKALCQQFSEDEMRDFYLSFNCRGLSLQNIAFAPGTPSATWSGPIEIYDLEGLGWEQLHMPGLLRLSRVVRLGASLFPDNLGLAVVINAPTIFHFAWQILKRVLPDDTIARVQIRADDGRSVLEEILGGAAALDALLASRDEERSAAQAGLFVLGVDLDHLVAEQGQHENPQEPKTAHSEQQQQLVGLSLLTA